MKVEYSERAIDDINKIAVHSRAFGRGVAEAVEIRLSEIITHIARHPESAREVTQRPGVRVAPLIRFPFVVFYRVLQDRIKILHVRHTSRRSWEGK